MPHKGICPLLKKWRKAAKGKATAESAELRDKMVEYLRAALSAVPGAGRWQHQRLAGKRTRRDA